MTVFKGPFAVPDEVFSERTLKKLFGEQWSITPEGWLRRNGTYKEITD